MSYGHCIVLPNQNRDIVQIIPVQDKAAQQQDFRWVPRVYMHNNTIGPVVILVMCMI